MDFSFHISWLLVVRALIAAAIAFFILAYVYLTTSSERSGAGMIFIGGFVPLLAGFLGLLGIIYIIRIFVFGF